MTVEADGLPDDASTLKAMLIAERVRNERLLQIIKELQRHRFGRRAETLPEDQMLLGLEEVEQVAASNEAQIEAANPAGQASRASKRRMNRGSLPARIGEDTGERLDIVPAQFRVLVVRRPKYGCRGCEDVVVQAPAPARLIEGGLPTEGTVAQVLVSICRSPSALSAGPDLRSAGRCARSLDAGRLGRACSLLVAAGS